MVLDLTGHQCSSLSRGAPLSGRSILHQLQVQHQSHGKPYIEHITVVHWVRWNLLVDPGKSFCLQIVWQQWQQNIFPRQKYSAEVKKAILDSECTQSLCCLILTVLYVISSWLWLADLRILSNSKVGPVSLRAVLPFPQGYLPQSLADIQSVSSWRGHTHVWMKGSSQAHELWSVMVHGHVQGDLLIHLHTPIGHLLAGTDRSVHIGIYVVGLTLHS